MRVIYTSPDGFYRVVERATDDYTMEDLKGDSYNPQVNSDIDPAVLKAEELAFEELVNREGVYGYTLEYWDATPNVGWKHVDSCWGFVGMYNPNDDMFNHYIVDELKNAIPLVAKRNGGNL